VAKTLPAFSPRCSASSAVILFRQRPSVGVRVSAAGTGCHGSAEALRSCPVLRSGWVRCWVCGHPHWAGSQSRAWPVAPDD